MTRGLRVNNNAPVGERPSDIIRGRTGVAVAGVSSILGSAISGTPANGDVLVYDSATDTWISESASFSIPAGTYELAIEGGQSVIKAHGNTGSTETFDPTDGNVHTCTLDAACTFTLNAPTGSSASLLEIRATQDGTGGRVITWPGSVAWVGGTTPSPATTASTTAVYVLETVDGGTNWLAGLVGAPAVTSVAMTVPAEFAIAGSPITGAGTLALTKATETANTVWAGPTSGSAAQPAFRALVLGDIPGGVTPDHEHVNNIQFNGDGATLAFELPAAPFDAWSVVASVAGVITDVTLSGTMLTTMTFASAPASGTNNIRVDIVAVAA